MFLKLHRVNPIVKRIIDVPVIIYQIACELTKFAALKHIKRVGQILKIIWRECVASDGKLQVDFLHNPSCAGITGRK